MSTEQPFLLPESLSLDHNLKATTHFKKADKHLERAQNAVALLQTKYGHPKRPTGINKTKVALAGYHLASALYARPAAYRLTAGQVKYHRWFDNLRRIGHIVAATTHLAGLHSAFVTGAVSRTTYKRTTPENIRRLIYKTKSNARQERLRRTRLPHGPKRRRRKARKGYSWFYA